MNTSVQANLRGLFRSAGHHGVVSYEKEPGHAAYIIGEDGDTLLEIKAPRRFYVPVVEYTSEGAIQDRLAALLWQGALYSAGDREFPRATAAGALETLRNLFKGRDLDLAAIVGDVDGLRRMSHEDLDGVPLHGPVTTWGAEPRVLLGVAPPQFVGEIAEIRMVLNGQPVWSTALSLGNPLGVIGVQLVGP